MKYRWIEGKEAGFEHVYALRHEVFVKEQGYTEEGEFDEKDAVCRHIVGFEKDKPVCSARILETEPGVVFIGRVVVLPAYRGHGYGLEILKKMIAQAKKMGAKAVRLNAQADKTHFYECAGFVCTGGTSQEEGHPHVEMQLEL